MIIKIHFHKKGFALGLVLKQRLAVSPEWPIGNAQRSKEKAEHRKREGTGDCTGAGNSNIERTTEQNAIGNKQENAKWNAHLHCY